MERHGDTELVLWVTEGASPPSTAATAEPATQLEFQNSSPVELEEHLQHLGSAGRIPSAVVIDYDVERPLRAARRIYSSLPLSQILFRLPAERLAEFRGEVSRAPMIGTNWSVIGMEEAELRAQLAAAVRTSRQRRQLRTNLDAINLRLSRPRPATDSNEYRKLAISDKYLATILEYARDAILSLDLQGRIASWNQGAADLFGYTLRQALNLRVGDLAAHDSQEQLARWFAEALRNEPVSQGELLCKRADGTEFFAELTLAPVRDEGGEIIAVSLIGRDVTERKETEAELRSMQTELEQRVTKRTEALRYLNEELEAFTYSASHDLRAPLRGIDGFSQALLEDYGTLLDPTATHYVERIRAGARRMGEIIDALLMLSRISTARLHVASVDLGKLSREILRELQETEPDRRVEMRIAEGLEVKADPQLMRIVLQNLLGNAWKFTRERDVAEIEVGCAKDGVFFVRDNGAGFDMAYVDRLFEPFQRVHDQDRFEGSGIGLGTVRRVINRHGGKVWGQGEPDVGATFYFELPTTQVLPRVLEGSLGGTTT